MKKLFRLLNRSFWWGVGLLCFLFCVVMLPHWEVVCLGLLKVSFISPRIKNELVAIYRPASVEVLRNNASLYNGGFDTRGLPEGPAFFSPYGYNYVDTLGLLLTKEFFTNADPFQYGIARVEKNGKVGLLNDRGKWVVPPEYSRAWVYPVAIVLEKAGKQGMVNREGKQLTPFEFERIEASYFALRLPFFLFYQTGEDAFGVIDAQGMVQSDNRFDTLHTLGPVYCARSKGKWSVFSAQGVEEVPPLYDSISVCSRDYFAVQAAGKWGVYGRLPDKEMVPTRYDRVSLCGPDFFAVKQERRYGLVDVSGALIIPPMYDSVYYHHTPDWMVLESDSLFLLCRATQVAEQRAESYQMVTPFSCDVTRVKQDGHWGTLSADGDWILTPIYDTIYPYSNQVAVICDNQEYGVVDRDGVFLIPFSLTLVDIHSFFDGRALASRFNLHTSRISKLFGFIDKNGRTLIPFRYEAGHERFSESLAGVKFNGQWGYIDTLGSEVIPFVYDSVTPFTDHVARVYKDSLSFMIDRYGKIDSLLI